MPTAAVHALGRDAGTAVWYMGSLTTIKASHGGTAGAFGLVEQTAPVGFATPYHVHRAEDEVFYVLHGELAVLSDGRWHMATPGSYVYLPRDVPHGMRVVGSTAATYLVLVTPAGFEQFFIDLGEPATAPGLPPGGGAPDYARLAATAASYDIDILGPLPDGDDRLPTAVGVVTRAAR